MFQRITTAVREGMRICCVTVEIDILSGMPLFTILGVGDAYGRSIKERVRSTILSAGFHLPAKRITVNLVCEKGVVPKEGLDLPIALGILCADRSLPSLYNGQIAVIGGLSLNGDLQPVHGVSGLVTFLRDEGFQKLLLPSSNAYEAAIVPGIDLLCADTFSEASAFWRGAQSLPIAPHRALTYESPPCATLLSIRGQRPGKRALAIACAGFHNLLLCGPPGCGKTLLAGAAPSLLPAPSEDEMSHLSTVRSLLGEDMSGTLTRSIVRPHHSISRHALIGGGRPIAPGQMSRADRGLLILDEIAEFSSHVLENLRQPLEEHFIRLSYLSESVILPADFMLIATMNLCPCGYFPDTDRCICSPAAVRRYQGRLGAPLLERIDLCLMLDPVPPEDAQTLSPLEVTRLTEQIQSAAERQRYRYKGEAFWTNSRVPPERMEDLLILESDAARFFTESASVLGISLRTQHNVIKTARTIADLAEKDRIDTESLAEALQYRPKGFLFKGEAP